MINTPKIGDIVYYSVYSFYNSRRMIVKGIVTQIDDNYIAIDIDHNGMGEIWRKKESLFYNELDARNVA